MRASQAEDLLEDVIKKAMEVYEMIVGKKFEYRHVWEIVRHIPKFNIAPIIRPKKISLLSESEVSTSSGRPMGIKQVRKVRK